MAGLVLADCAVAQSMTSNEVKGTNISRKWRGTPGLVTTMDVTRPACDGLTIRWIA